MGCVGSPSLGFSGLYDDRALPGEEEVGWEAACIQARSEAGTPKLVPELFLLSHCSGVLLTLV